MRSVLITVLSCLQSVGILQYILLTLFAGDVKASIWVPWYFKRRALTLITLPLFLWFVYCIVVSIFGAVIQSFAIIRVCDAVFGTMGTIGACFLGWIPIFIPPFLYCSAIKALPELHLKTDASRRIKIFGSIAVFILLPLIAFLVYHGDAWIISWIADHNPQAAFAVGVTGHKN